MIATETIAHAPTTKLKIKISTKRLEIGPTSRCGFGEKVPQHDENGSCKSIKKSSLPDSNKRKSPENIESQKRKRQRIDRKGSQQCATILKSLMSDPYGWVFNKPVDPVALNVPDYFSIISHPMDLGTIKSKLEKNIYSSMEEFAADVRLTFSNAMTYNPPTNDVHLMAKELNMKFRNKWKDMDKRWNCEDEHEKNMTGIVKETVQKRCNGTLSRHKGSSTKIKSQVSEHKGIHKISSLATRDAKVEVAKLSHIPCKPVVKDCIKGSKERDPAACGAVAFKQSYPTKSTSPLQRKSDPGSDGTVSSLDSEHACPSSQHGNVGTDASSGEVWSTPVLPEQLSPKKALRAAMLKSRFADTILKAQQKTLLEHGDKYDPLKLQREKEKLERMQREERARIEAQMKNAESARMRAGEVWRIQIEKEREAARAAVEKVKRTVHIEDNLAVVKELERLSGCTLSYKALGGRNEYRYAKEKLDKLKFENPLERLGLFLKDEYIPEDEEEGWEEGEIF